MTTVGDLSEDQLLARIVPRLPRSAAVLIGPGDDAAVLAAPDGRFVVTTDVLVEDHHFRRDWSSGVDVGWRAVMQNLADVAAMGAVPTAIVTSLVMPPDLDVTWVEDLADGLALACAPGVGAVGGDLSAGPAIMVAVTAHGDLRGGDPVRRDGAQPGDQVCVAGVLGHSAAGLAILEARGRCHPSSVSHTDSDDQRHLPVRVTDVVDRFLRPNPPLELGPVAARAGVRAMMDISDGLLRDAGRMARASNVRIDLFAKALAGYAAELEGLARPLGLDPWQWVLTGGEDHGLLATFAPGPAPEGFTMVGTVEVGTGVTVDGDRPNVVGSGWDHFGV